MMIFLGGGLRAPMFISCEHGEQNTENSASQPTIMDTFQHKDNRRCEF